MTKQTHLQSLLAKHLKIDNQIKHIETRAFTSQTQLFELKRNKLQIKDEIEKIQSTLPLSYKKLN